MKKTLLVFGFATAAVAAQAQKANALKANLISPAVKTGSFSYERRINDRMSGQIGFGVTNFTIDDVNFKGLFVTPEFRYYFTGTALNGTYVGPYLRYRGMAVQDKSVQNADKATLHSVGGGVVVGHEWLLGNIVTLDVFAGPNFSGGKLRYEEGSGNTSVPAAFSGFGVRAGFNFGIAF